MYCFLIPVGVLCIWLIGWLVTAAYMFYRDPRLKDESPEDRRGRRKAVLAINLFLWPSMLFQVPSQFGFQRDIETGKRPSWLVLSEGESTSAEWVGPDGWTFWIATTGELSTTPSSVMLSHEASARKRG